MTYLYDTKTSYDHVEILWATINIQCFAIEDALNTISETLRQDSRHAKGTRGKRLIRNNFQQVLLSCEVVFTELRNKLEDRGLDGRLEPNMRIRLRAVFSREELVLQSQLLGHQVDVLQLVLHGIRT